MNAKKPDDETQKRLEALRRILPPTSCERAREISDEYTKHMREKVEQARKKEKGSK